jgi:hypothetical protein
MYMFPALCVFVISTQLEKKPSSQRTALPNGQSGVVPQRPDHTTTTHPSQPTSTAISTHTCPRNCRQPYVHKPYLMGSVVLSLSDLTTSR